MTVSVFILVTLLISIFTQGTLAAVSSNITKNKTFYEIPDGGLEKIRCEIPLGNPNQTVSWEVDGMLLTGNMSTESATRYFNFNVSGNASLIIKNPLLSTTYGLFNVTCIANSTGGIIQRIMYQVKLFKAPRITNNQGTYDVPEYGSGKINLHCEVEGFPLPVTNWSIRGNILLEGQTYFMNTSKPFNITVLTNGSLRIQTLRRNEAGFGVSVTCIANNSAGSDENTFLVRFLEAPRILTKSSNIAILKRSTSTAYIDCETTGYPKPMVEWKFGEYVRNASQGSLVIEVIGHSSLVQIKFGEASYQVFINGTLRMRQTINDPSFAVKIIPYENFTCIARNIAGEVSRTHDFYTGEPPRITNNQETYDVPEYGSGKINLHCEVEGFPLPVTTWSIRGNILLEGQTYFMNTSKPFNITVLTNGGLRIQTLRRNEAGFGVNVTCIANNSVGSDENTYLVRFLEAPRILTNSSNIAILKRNTSTVYIDCETTGYPKPMVEWKFGEYVRNPSQGSLVLEAIRHSKLVLLTFGEASYQVFINGTLRMRQTINDLSLTVKIIPFENFTCIARNIAGEVSRTHDFYTGELISYTFEVILLKDEFTGQENNNFKKIRDVFQNDKVYYSITIKAVNSTLRTVYFELTWKEEDLMSDDKLKSTTTIANDVATALNKVWNITGFELIMDALPGPSTDLIATDVTSSEITFSWKHPKYFKVTRYQIQINHGKGDFKNVNQVSGDKTSATINDLNADTKYLIKMESINDEGVGEIPSETLQVETKDDVPVTIIVVVVVLFVVVLSGVALIYLYYRRIRNAPERLMLALGENPYEFSIPGVTFGNIYVRDDMTYCPTGNLDGSSQQEFFSWKEISRDCLAMGDTLGQGEFGLVVKAMWTEDQSKQGFPVAVKTIKGNATETDRKELFKELKLMADVAKHPNVVNLHGACSKGGPLWVVVEFCEFGNLLGYLKKNRNETSGNDGTFVTSVDPLVRVRIAYDVSKGMRYLEEKKIVHRDLAARNVLLGKNRIAKVSDFGLSRDIYEVGLYQKSTGGKLPVKWMAIESLQEATYTSKSDIWSFGVLLWEIETAGMVPYPGIPGRDLLGLLQRGLRLDKPPGTEDEIYDLMTTCWQPVAKVRPDFSEIESKLESYLEERSDYLPVVVDDNDSSGDAYTDYFVEPDEDEPISTTRL